MYKALTSDIMFGTVSGFYLKQHPGIEHYLPVKIQNRMKGIKKKHFENRNNRRRNKKTAFFNFTSTQN